MRLRLTILFLALLPCVWATEIPITQTPRISPTPIWNPVAIVSDGSTYLVFGEALLNFNRYGDYNFAGTLVRSDGSLITPRGFAIGDSVGQYVAAAGNGREYLVVTGAKYGVLSGFRVSSDGQVLDTSALPIGISGPNGNPFLRALSVAWDGTSFVVVWVTADGAGWYELVGEDGRVQQANAISTDVRSASVAAHNGASVLVWSDAEGVWARAITQDGTSEPIRLSANGIGGSVTAGGEEFAVIWSENGVETMQRLDNSGRPIAASIALPIRTPDSLAASWDGTSYVLVWSDGSGVRGVRVSEAGAIGTTFDVDKIANAYVVGAASANGITGVVVADSPWGSLKRIGPSEIVSPSANAPGDNPFPWVLPQTNVHAVFNGVDYNVFFEDGGDIRCSRITLDRRRLDGDGFVVGHGSLRDVAAGSGRTLVVWTEAKSGTPTALRAARIDASGMIVDTPALTLDTVETGSTRALWNGSEFVVFWANYADPRVGRTLAARITADGQILDNPAREVFPTALKFDVAKSEDVYQLAYVGAGLNVVSVSLDLHLATASHMLSLPGESVKSFSITSNGDDFFLAWNNEAEEIAGRRASWAAEPLGPRVLFSDDANKKGRPQVGADGTEITVAWPEVEGPTVAFKMRRIDADDPTDIGPLHTFAHCPAIAGLQPPSLNDRSYVPAQIPAVAYGRSDEVNGLIWYERLFLQEAFSDRHRVVH